MTNRFPLKKFWILCLGALIPMLLAACDQMPSTAYAQGGSDQTGQASEAQPGQASVLEPGKVIEFTGTLEGAEEGAYTIDGVSANLVFDADRKIETGLESGMQVTVEALIQPDGSLYILQIHADGENEDKDLAADELEDPEAQDLSGNDQEGDDLTPDEGEDQEGDDLTADEGEVQEDEEFEFSGVVETVGAGIWVIGGQTVLVDAETELDAEVGPGALVRVEGVVSNGQYLAHAIELDEYVGLGDDDSEIIGNPGDDDAGDEDEGGSGDADDDDAGDEGDDSSGDDYEGGNYDNGDQDNGDDIGNDDADSDGGDD